MQILRTIVFGTTFIYLLLGLVDWVSAKPKEVYRSKPIPQSQIQIDPSVLQEHQKRFGTTSSVVAPPSRTKRPQKTNPQPQGPKIVETGVGPMTPVDQIMEKPVLPTRVGDYPYQYKYTWGKQKTLKEMLGLETATKKGPTR